MKLQRNILIAVGVLVFAFVLLHKLFPNFTSLGEREADDDQVMLQPAKSGLDSVMSSSGETATNKKPASTIGQDVMTEKAEVESREADVTPMIGASNMGVSHPAYPQASPPVSHPASHPVSLPVSPRDKAQHVSLPDKLLLPVEQTRVIKRDKSRLHQTDLEVLDFINTERRMAGLSELPTLPTGLNDQECLALLNAMRRRDGLGPLAQMPTGAKIPD